MSNDNLDNKLDTFKTKYPNLFRNINYLEIDAGWVPLLHSMCSHIERHITELPEELQADVYVDQIKEKFGTLRFNMNQETPFIRGVICLGESLSHRICERCGAAGKIRVGGWIKTLCDGCYQSQEESIKKSIANWKDQKP